ncbi:hypothetical protein D5086_005436 [Populus alba]|uniref:Uncharacterized protein n=1 Tax=Populus alba TaxID=43335 RepID=A0ACC4CUM6_POPAL
MDNMQPTGYRMSAAMKSVICSTRPSRNHWLSLLWALSSHLQLLWVHQALPPVPSSAPLPRRHSGHHHRHGKPVVTAPFPSGRANSLVKTFSFAELEKGNRSSVSSKRILGEEEEFGPSYGSMEDGNVCCPDMAITRNFNCKALMLQLWGWCMLELLSGRKPVGYQRLVETISQKESSILGNLTSNVILFLRTVAGGMLGRTTPSVNLWAGLIFITDGLSSGPLEGRWKANRFQLLS